MIYALIILYVVTLISFSITERFRNYAKLIATQGWILLFIALLKLHTLDIMELIFVLVETLVFKALLVPSILMKIINQTKINRILLPGKSQLPSLIWSLGALVVSIVTTKYVADSSVNVIFFGVAIYSLLSGLLLILRRRRLFSHLVGFLIVENGVFLFSMAMGVEIPFLVNIAILLDILLSVLMLGFFVRKVGTDMHAIDADKLTTLKD